jgi:hypothetical protein
MEILEFVGKVIKSIKHDQALEIEFECGSKISLEIKPEEDPEVGTTWPRIVFLLA